MSLQKENKLVNHNGSSTNITPPESTNDTRLIKLIAVSLKESALDSPSFRASLNYYNRQLDQTEQWIEGLLKSTKKYPQHYNDFKEINTVLLNQLIPNFLKEGIIDQENTSIVLDHTKTNLESLWAESLDNLAVLDAEITDQLNDITKIHIRHYKEIRKNFEFMQSKYDGILSKYSAQAKTKEPSALREDAFQLFDVRKSYLSASLNISIEIAKLHEKVDATLLKLAETIFKNKESYDEKYFARVNAWSSAIQKSVNSLLEDMNRSKEQIEEATVAQWEPTRDLKQHNTALINPANLTKFDPDIDGPTEDPGYEKHGWLFMKTFVGKPSRQIWVRRWVFVKCGIFGLLSVAPSKAFVQESDKIGVLLCNIRYAPDDDRRFCFEIKTIESTIVFQAESLKELRSWLRVFSLEKQRAIENSSGDSGKYAFGRYPPSLYEFASTSLTSIDLELTSSKVENSNADDTHTTFTSAHLSNIDQNYSTVVDLFDISTPITTSKSKIALLSRAHLEPTVVPTAVTANIWGSVNWGSFYTKVKENKNFSTLKQEEAYPSYYPAHMRSFDSQLRSLFDSSIAKNEHVVLHFSCLWSLNPGQELSGRCFVTTKNTYFYLNSTGFVSLLKRPLSDIIAVDVTADKEWDNLKVYDIQGLNMKGRIFLDDGKLIQKKLDLLIHNNAKEKPKGQSEIIPLLEAIKTDEYTALKTKTATDQSLDSFQPLKGVKVDNKSMRTNYRGDYDLLAVERVNIPAKALFHVLYGDNSSLLRDTLSFIDADDFRLSPWYNFGNGELTRYVDFKINLSKDIINLKGKEGNMDSRMTQVIEEKIENKYYRVEEIRNLLRIVFDDVVEISRKIIIIEEDARNSKLLVYVRTKYPSGNKHFLLNRIVRKTILHYHNTEVGNLVAKAHKAALSLGNHGKILKAIRTYGNLSMSEDADTTAKREPLLIDINYRLILKYYAKLSLVELTRTVLRFIRLLATLTRKFISALSVNKLLLVLLAGSILFDIFLMGKSTLAFWQAKRIESFFKNVEYNKFERSLSIDELDVLSSFNSSTSECLKRYLSSSFLDDKSARVDSRFRESRHEIAVKRNELLVELKILEKMETELIGGNYKNFLLSELNLCKVALEDNKVEDETLEQYCSNCISEYQGLL